MEIDQAAIEQLFQLIFAVLCLETGNDSAASRIGLIADCSEPSKSELSAFLEAKVFRLLDEKGEQHLSPKDSNHRSHEFDLSAVKRTVSSSNRDDVSQLLEQIRACDTTILKLRAELMEANERIEAEAESAADIKAQLEHRDSEISRLADELSRATESVSPSH